MLKPGTYAKITFSHVSDTTLDHKMLIVQRGTDDGRTTWRYLLEGRTETKWSRHDDVIVPWGTPDTALQDERVLEDGTSAKHGTDHIRICGHRVAANGQVIYRYIHKFSPRGKVFSASACCIKRLPDEPPRLKAGDFVEPFNPPIVSTVVVEGEDDGGTCLIQTMWGGSGVTRSADARDLVKVGALI
jgi:hypothetical protein